MSTRLARFGILSFVVLAACHPVVVVDGGDRTSDSSTTAAGANSAETLAQKDGVDEEESPRPDEDRQKIVEERAALVAAIDGYQEQLKTYPAFIPAEEEERRRERSAVEQKLIQARLKLGESMYLEAQTWPSDDPQRTELLASAAAEFKEIHSAFRSMVGGLLARLWQGRCLDELGETGAALGIYAELLQHPGAGTTIGTIQTQARLSQLVAYNGDSRREYRLVNRLAQEWLDDEAHGPWLKTESGVGIEWQQALALEKLGTDRTIPEDERNGYLRRAMQIALREARREGPYQSAAAALLLRNSTNADRGEKDTDVK